MEIYSNLALPNGSARQLDKESTMTVINLESKALANWTQLAGPVKTPSK
jgi:hypothetical protein